MNMEQTIASWAHTRTTENIYAKTQLACNPNPLIMQSGSIFDKHIQHPYNDEVNNG